MCINTVANALDFVKFHSDVLNILHAVNEHRPKTIVAIVFVKTPVQLTLICFSAVTAILAAVREVFTALGYFLLDPGLQRSFDHTIRAGAQLLGVPVAVFGTLFALLGESEWVVSRHIDLGNYIPKPAPPLRPRSVQLDPSMIPPPLPRDNDALSRSEDDSTSSESDRPDSNDSSDSESPIQSRQLKPSYARPRSTEFQQGMERLRPVADRRSSSQKPSLRAKKTLNPRKLAEYLRNKSAEQPIFVEKAQKEGKEGWRAVTLNISELKKTISDFNIPYIQDAFDQDISDLSEYLKAHFNSDSIQLNHIYLVGDWEFIFERFEDEEIRPQVFISRRASSSLPNSALQQAESAKAEDSDSALQQRQKPRARKNVIFHPPPPTGNATSKSKSPVTFSKKAAATMSSSSDPRHD